MFNRLIVIICFILFSTLSSFHLAANEMIDFCAYPLQKNGESILPNNGYVDVHTNLHHTNDPLTKGLHSARTFITYELLKNILEIKKLWGLGILDLGELEEIKDDMTSIFRSYNWKNKIGRLDTEEYHAKKLQTAVEKISSKVNEYYSINDNVKNLYIDYDFLNQKPGHTEINKSFCPIYSIINQIESTPFDYTVAPDYQFYNAFQKLLDASIALSEIDYKISFFTKFIWDEKYGSRFRDIMLNKYQKAIKSGKVKVIESRDPVTLQVSTSYRPSFNQFEKDYKDKYFAESGIANYVAILQATKDSVLLQKEELQYETNYYFETKSGKGIYKKERPFYQYMYDLLISKKGFPKIDSNYDKKKLEGFHSDWENDTATVAMSIPTYLDQEKMGEYSKLKNESSEDIFNFDHKIYEMVNINHASLQEKREEYDKICKDKPEQCEKALLISLTGFRHQMRGKIISNTLGKIDFDTFEEDLETHSFDFSDTYLSLWKQWKIKFNNKGEPIRSDKDVKEVYEYFFNNKVYQDVAQENDPTADYAVKTKAPDKFPIKYTVRDEFIQIFREISKERLVAQTHLLESISQADSKIGNIFTRGAGLFIANNPTHFSWVHMISLMLKDHFELDIQGVKQNLDLNNMLWIKMKNFYATYLIYPNGKARSVFNWSSIKNEFRRYWNDYEQNVAVAKRQHNIFFWSTLGVSIGTSTVLRNVIKGTFTKFKSIRKAWRKKGSSQKSGWLGHVRKLISKRMAGFNPLLFKRNQMNVGIPMAKAPVSALKKNHEKLKKILSKTSEVSMNLGTIDFGWGAIGKTVYARSYASFLHSINFGAANLGISNLNAAKAADVRQLDSARSMIWAIVLSGAPMRVIRVKNKLGAVVKDAIKRRKELKASKKLSQAAEAKKQIYFIEKAKFLAKKFRRTMTRYGGATKQKVKIYMPGLVGLVNLGGALKTAVLDFTTMMKAHKAINDAFTKAYDEIFLLRKNQVLAEKIYQYAGKNYQYSMVGGMVRKARQAFSPTKWNTFYDKKEALNKFTSLMSKEYNAIILNGNLKKIADIKDATKRHDAFIELIKKSTDDFGDPAVRDIFLKHLKENTTNELILNGILKMSKNNKTFIGRKNFLGGATWLSGFAPNATVIQEILVESTLSIGADFIFSGSEIFHENLVYTLTNLFVGWVIVGYNTFNATASPAYNKMFDLAGKFKLKNAVYQSQKLGGVVFASCMFASLVAELTSKQDFIDENNPNFESWGDRFQRMLATSAVYAGFSALTGGIRTAFITDVAARAKIYDNKSMITYASNQNSELITKKGVWPRIGEYFGYTHKDPEIWASFISNWWGTYTAQALLRNLGVQSESAVTSGSFTMNTYHDYDKVVDTKLKKFFDKYQVCQNARDLKGKDMESKLLECVKFKRENSKIVRMLGKTWNDIFEEDFYHMHSFFKIDVEPRYNKTAPDMTFPDNPDLDELTDEELDLINEF